MKKIKIGIIGVGNCASSLIQGIEYYKSKNKNNCTGLMHWDIGGYKPYDIEIVCAFDIDGRKVGKEIHEAIFEEPNCTKIFCDSFNNTNSVVVSKGKQMDGISSHMINKNNDKYFLPVDDSDVDEEKIVNIIKKSGVPILGDDIKSQFGATIVHRVLTELFEKRGGIIDKTYQLNTGGNTDFLNMLNRDRLKYKKISKTEAVRSIMNDKLSDVNIHVGPSDYVAWQNDNKKCFIRIEGRIFGDTPITLDTQLSVEDSPNSAGVVIDAIRCCKLALERGLSGTIVEPSTYFFKHPIVQVTDDEAYNLVEKFISKF